MAVPFFEAVMLYITNPPVVGLVHGGSVPSPSRTLGRDQVVPDEQHLSLRNDDFRGPFPQIGAVCSRLLCRAIQRSLATSALGVFTMYQPRRQTCVAYFKQSISSLRLA